jgi:phage tail-like protein
MPTGERKDPFKQFNFLVEIDGITQAGFQEASGLDSTQDPIEYREGNDALTVHKLPGLNKYSNITLKWGVTDSVELFEWRKKAVEGKVERKNGSIVLRDDAGEEKVRWNFAEAWPTAWKGPGLNATGNAVAVEELTLAHEGLTKA